jgi:hypothetical protein
MRLLREVTMLAVLSVRFGVVVVEGRLLLPKELGVLCVLAFHCESCCAWSEGTTTNCSSLGLRTNGYAC